MLLKNGRKLFGRCINGTALSAGDFVGIDGTPTNATSTSSSFSAYALKSTNNLKTLNELKLNTITNKIGTCLLLSQEDTLPTIDDYTCECISELSVESVSMQAGDTNSFVVSYSKKVTNQTSENITVKSVALASILSVNSTSGSEVVLIYREVLETPVVIAPDETYTFTVALK